ncbi:MULTISPECIES: TetR family transcriptional regulator [Shouchella]|uniref:TetR family transcriptional regulator n=2 Tax=Shouchella TaxID=2893057 RepID=A0ABY7WA29_9BACI|nr:MULTISPECIES: TetR family transcriptional regulator [Shouchella]MED4128730.1 TetR family transcriptional regulator [Shouchella miscanthi]WDF05762.1 TetR family transcriptional regulator [Shouchella hunanensis]GAF20497.1 transcriptional regulator, TetR family [Bacillus sp. JCM 19047]
MDKRERIITAAIEAFSEKGVEKTTISDIVKRANIAQGTYYLYFPSKLSVMPDIAAVFVDHLMVELNKNVTASSFKQQLNELVDTVFHTTEHHKKLAVLIYSGLTQSEHLQQWETIYTPLYDWLADRLEQAKQSGGIRKSLRSDATARIMVGTIESTAEQLYLYNQEDIDYVNEHKQELIIFLTNALGASD